MEYAADLRDERTAALTTVVLWGWLLLDESPPALALAGGAVCLLGVIVARRG